MKPIRILTSLAVIGVSIYCYNAYQNRPNALAQACLTETDGRTAVELCKTALLSDDLLPNERGDVAFGIGYLLHNADPGQAIEYYSKAAAVYPEKTTAFHNRGMLLLEAEDYDAAIADLTVAIDRMEAGGRSYDNVYWRRAFAFDMVGQPDQAIADYSRQIEITPDAARPYSNIANIHRKSGDYDTAMIYMADAIRLAPTDIAVINKQFNIFKDQKNYAAMALALEDAVGHHPDNPDLWRNKSFAEAQLGDYEVALNSIDRAIASGSDTGWTWHHRGWILTKLDREVEAYGDWRKAVAIESDNQEAANLRGVLYAHIQKNMNTHGIIPAIEPYFAAYPDDGFLAPIMSRLIRNALNQSGDADAAISTLTDLVTVHGTSVDLRSELQAVLFARSSFYTYQGRNLSAFTDFQRALGDNATAIEYLEERLTKEGLFSGDATGKATPEFTAALRACFFDPSCVSG